MKPRDLKIPLERLKQKVIIRDGICHIPRCTQTLEKFIFPDWNHPEIFGNENPISIEYCSGNGSWIAEKALAEPSVNWVAIEMKFTRVKKIWSKIKNFGLKNLFIVNGEGRYATAQYFQDNTVQDIYINFPDPWPKRCHAKNRLLQTSFVNEMSRILKKGGTLTCVTDDPGYSEWTLKLLNEHPCFINQHPDSHYVTENPGYGGSFFESLWKEKGKTIRYHQFVII